MVANSLIAEYEKALIAPLEALGDTRFTKRIFAHATNEGIWRGLWICLNSRRPRTIVQPNLGVFCPAAHKIVNKGLAAIYGPKAGQAVSAKLGNPIITCPLYAVVRDLRQQDRMPFSYDVTSDREIEVSVAMMASDYANVRNEFFGAISSLQMLEERLLREHMPSSAMSAMAVAHLISGKLGRHEIAARAKLSPNEMTQEFAEWFAAVYVDE